MEAWCRLCGRRPPSHRVDSRPSERLLQAPARALDDPLPRHLVRAAPDRKRNRGRSGSTGGRRSARAVACGRADPVDLDLAHEPAPLGRHGQSGALAVNTTAGLATRADADAADQGASTMDTVEAVRVGSMLYLSGALGIDSTGTIVPGGIVSSPWSRSLLALSSVWIADVLLVERRCPRKLIGGAIRPFHEVPGVQVSEPVGRPRPRSSPWSPPMAPSCRCVRGRGIDHGTPTPSPRPSPSCSADLEQSGAPFEASPNLWVTKR